MELANRIAGAAAIGAAMLIGSGLSAPSAQAGYVVHLKEQGVNVVASGSGAIDLAGLALNCIGCFFSSAQMNPTFGVILTGENAQLDVYSAVMTGPVRFGHGTYTGASSSSGELVGFADGLVFGQPSQLYVPTGYVSDSPLSNTATYDGQTFSSLGVTPGRYEWTWGSGANQNFMLVIGVPEPATWTMMLLGFAGLGFLGFRSCLNGWPPKVA